VNCPGIQLMVRRNMKKPGKCTLVDMQVFSN